ncbi:MAG: 4Fe-4S binding protein [Dehalococcoidia bacterium]|nr:4Fe-4S binding protein [Dehalococcoidia bacterium]
MPKADNELTWRDLEIGCIATNPGSSSAYRTGDWRSQHPEYDFSRCIKCGMCQMYCPEGCIQTSKEGYFEANLYHCKGCGICARECPVWVISMKEGTK